MREFKPFKLTKCKKKYNRRRTLSVETIFYNTFFEPKGLSRSERRFSIDTFKHPLSKRHKIISERMIENSLTEFFERNNINQWDIIGGVHSSSSVVKKILKSIQMRYPNKIKIIPNLILKTRMLNKGNIVNNWEDIKFEVMLKGLRTKFSQNPELKQKLLDTGDEPIHEDSKDKVWGIDGDDMMGKLLMKVRKELK